MEDQEWVETTRDQIGRLNCYLDQEGMERLLSLYLLEDDHQQKLSIKNDIEAILGSYAPYLFFSKKPMLPSPTPEESAGEITLGTVMQGDKNAHLFSVSLRDIQKHTAIFSSTGMGKTTLTINILLQLLNSPNPIPWLYIDFKRDMRHLRKDSIWVFRWNWLKINPLQPPKGVSTHQWMQIVADTCAHCFGWFHASENYLMDFMHELYQSYKGEGYPTLQELYERIAKTKERSRKRMDYFDVVMNRIKSLLIVLGGVVDCRVGFPIEDMLNYPVVIELDGLRRDEQNLLVELLLAYIFTYRIANGHRGDLRHVLVFDEATRVFFKKREWRETTIELGMPFIDTVPQILRDYSEGLVFAAQEPSIISHSVLANANLKMVGFLGEGGDIETLAKSLDLDDEERSAISKLECGEWLVKKSGIKPFLLRSSDYPLEKNVTDEELEERMRPVLSKLNEMVVPIQRAPEHVISIKPKIPQLSKDAERLLFNVNVHPFRGLSTRYKMLGLSGRRAETAKNELIQKRLVEEVSVVLGSHRPVKFLVISELGLHYLRKAEQKTSLWHYIGHVSFEHRLYQVLIAYSFRNAGHQAFIEKNLGDGRRLDVLVILDNKRIGVEVELNPNIDLRKILKSMKELDELAILCKDQSVLEKVRETIDRVVYPSLRRKIRLHLANEYLASLKGNIRAYKDGNKSNYPK